MLDVVINLDAVKNGQGRLLAVMDGHGETAQFVQNLVEKVTVSLRQIFETALAAHAGDVERAMRAVFAELHAIAKTEEAGTTLSLVYVSYNEQKAYAAVLGDSPVIILGADDKFYKGAEHNLLTNRQEILAVEQRVKTDRRKTFSDVDRFKLAGGYLVKQVDDRGQTIRGKKPMRQLSRSLGDSRFAAVMNDEPEIFTVALGLQSLIVLGSDGVVKITKADDATTASMTFDSMDAMPARLQDLMTRVINQGLSAEQLVSVAVREWKTDDNVTVVIWKNGNGRFDVSGGNRQKGFAVWQAMAVVAGLSVVGAAVLAGWISPVTGIAVLGGIGLMILAGQLWSNKRLHVIFRFFRIERTAVEIVIKRIVKQILRRIRKIRAVVVEVNIAEMLGKKATSDKGPEAQKDEAPAKAEIAAAEDVRTTPVGASVVGVSVPVSEEEIQSSPVGASVVGSAVPLSEGAVQETPVGASVVVAAVPVMEESSVGAVVLGASVPVIEENPVGAVFVAVSVKLSREELAVYKNAAGRLVDLSTVEAAPVKVEQRIYEVSLNDLMKDQRFLQESRGSVPVDEEETPEEEKAGSAAGSPDQGGKTLATVTGRVYEVAENSAAASVVTAVFKKPFAGKEHTVRGPPSGKVGDMSVVVKETEESVQVTLLEGVLNLNSQVDEGTVLKARERLEEIIWTSSRNEVAKLSGKGDRSIGERLRNIVKATLLVMLTSAGRDILRTRKATQLRRKKLLLRKG